MLTLLDYQKDHAESIERALLSPNRVALDASDPGTGKTYIGCEVAARLGIPTIILTPKATVPSWEKVCKLAEIKPLLVTNYENIRRGKLDICRKTDTGYEWHVPHETLIIFDECQKCKGRDSLNARLLIGARARHCRILLCSATAASNPLEMRALGFALGLHNLYNYWYWAKRNGVREGFFGMEFSGDEECLRQLHNAIFPLRGSRLRIADIPDFPETIIEPAIVETGKAKAIQDEYDNLKYELRKAEREADGNKLDEIAEALGSKKASHLTLVLRARQAIELHKVPAMVEMTKTAIEEGQSVVLLVNFTETICALAAKLNCSDIICGGQSAEERQSVIDRFQRNEIPVVIANIQAGGVGVSLHDPSGQRPRLSIISPTFSAADLRQALGRVHRAGGAASIQKICFAAGTCEEHTAQVCASKLAHIDLLNDGDMQPFPIQ